MGTHKALADFEGSPGIKRLWPVTPSSLTFSFGRTTSYSVHTLSSWLSGPSVLFPF